LEEDLLLKPEHSLLQLVVKSLPGKVGIIMDGVEVPSDPDSGPLLITSGSRPLMWLSSPLRGKFVRLAIRRCEDLGSILSQIVRAVSDEGHRLGWGNNFPPTKSGVLDATARVHYYELPSPVLVCGPDFDTELAPAIDHVVVSWMEPGWAVVVPDREYVGTAFLIGSDYVAAVVHNPSRGISVIRPE
jgi:hypothetical protein